MICRALSVVSACACKLGCPACVGPVEEVGPHGKETAERVLASIVHGTPLVPAEPELATPLEATPGTAAERTAPDAAGNGVHA